MKHYDSIMTIHIRDRDLTKCHRLWSTACEHFLLQSSLNQLQITLPSDKPRRGQPLPLEDIEVAATVDNILHGRAATNYTALARNYLGQVTDIRNRLKRWATQDDAASESAELDLVLEELLLWMHECAAIAAA